MKHAIHNHQVTYRSEGPNIKWEYFKKLHPAIRIIRELGKHMEQEFNTLARGKSHGTLKKDADVKLLESMYRAANVHDYTPGCKLMGSKRDKVQDVVVKGVVKLQSGPTLKHWHFGRSFPRALDEVWTVVSNNEGDSES